MHGVFSYRRVHNIAVPAPSKKIPTGGNGGVGGNVYVVSDKSLTSFSFETHHFNAEDGKNGGSKNYILCPHLVEIVIFY